MKIDMNQKILDIYGKEILTSENESLTLRKTCVEALLLEADGEKIEGAEKLKRYQLATSIHNTPDYINLTVEQIALIKQRIAIGYTIIVSGRVWELLEANQ